MGKAFDFNKESSFQQAKSEVIFMECDVPTKILQYSTSFYYGVVLQLL